MKKTFMLTFGLVLLLAATGYAQKFGYCNSAEVLTQIPEVKAADSDLQAFQAQLTKRGQDMVKALQEKAAELKRKEEQGTISPKELEAQSAKLKEDEAKIGAYEQEMMNKLSQKREELFKPIFDRFNKAMDDVAKENGFSMVFDKNTQVVLFADESLDVTKLLKTKMGIAN
ncbi:MAG: OmpH family outer membrane protein [Saprospiraceae bacterium]|nr:OmpH family outer membrane protein [Saprospiraceae bacterium]